MRGLFFLYEEYVYLSTRPDLAIDMCVQYITRSEDQQNVHSKT